MGLVQRILEASGLSTVTLSWMPALTRRAGVPRLAGISYPVSRPLGRPHDADGQRAVLRATLALLEQATAPDHYVELPFQWPETVAEARNASKDVPPSPIAALLMKQPWLVPRLYTGDLPVRRKELEAR